MNSFFRFLPHLAGFVLGAAFVTFGLNFFFKFLPMPPGPPDGSQAQLYMAALFSTGYLAFVKICEIVGGLLVMIPQTRNFGLLLIVPIVVNILAYQVFLRKSAGLFDPVVILVTVLSAYLLWCSRRAFWRLWG